MHMLKVYQHGFLVSVLCGSVWWFWCNWNYALSFSLICTVHCAVCVFLPPQLCLSAMWTPSPPPSVGVHWMSFCITYIPLLHGKRPWIWTAYVCVCVSHWLASCSYRQCMGNANTAHTHTAAQIHVIIMHLMQHCSNRSHSHRPSYYIMFYIYQLCVYSGLSLLPYICNA